MDYKAKVSKRIQEQSALLEELARQIGNHPELGFAEYEASRLLSGALDAAGYQVELGLAGLETAFRGRLGTEGPNIALLCEYDALPELGHACGHNLIGTASVGAALGLAPFLTELGGQLTVLGTPAEETGAGKAILAEHGIFARIDAAMMFHPSSQNLLMSTSTALDAYEFVYLGKPAHAADSPQKGVNALDGVIQLFNGINALREHLADSVRIHGIITSGGVAANIVPERAVARFYFRAPQRELLDETVEKILAIAKGAALISGAKVSWTKFEPSNENFVPNRTMALTFGANLQRLGVKDIVEYAEGSGSSDIGNVSRLVPTIHPYLSMGPGLVAHTAEFAQVSLGAEGVKVAILAAKALAHTAIDLFEKPTLWQAVKKEHGRQ